MKTTNTTRARLDADRTARPLTRIVHHAPETMRVGCGRPLINPELETLATGERVSLCADDDIDARDAADAAAEWASNQDD